MRDFPMLSSANHCSLHIEQQLHILGRKKEGKRKGLRKKGGSNALAMVVLE